MSKTNRTIQHWENLTRKSQKESAARGYGNTSIQHYSSAPTQEQKSVPWHGRFLDQIVPVRARISGLEKRKGQTNRDKPAANYRPLIERPSIESSQPGSTYNVDVHQQRDVVVTEGKENWSPYGNGPDNYHEIRSEAVPIPFDGDGSVNSERSKELVRRANKIIAQVSLSMHSSKTGSPQDRSSGKVSGVHGNKEDSLGRLLDVLLDVTPDCESGSGKHGLNRNEITRSSKDKGSPSPAKDVNVDRKYLHVPYSGYPDPKLDLSLESRESLGKQDSGLKKESGNQPSKDEARARRYAEHREQKAAPPRLKRSNSAPSLLTGADASWESISGKFDVDCRSGKSLEKFIPFVGSGGETIANPRDTQCQQKENQTKKSRLSEASRITKTATLSDAGSINRSRSTSLERKIRVTSEEFHVERPPSYEPHPSPPRTTPVRSPGEGRSWADFDFPPQRLTSYPVAKGQGVPLLEVRHDPSCSTLPSFVPAVEQGGEQFLRTRSGPPANYSPNFPSLSLISRTSSADDSVQSVESRDGLFAATGHDSVSTMSLGSEVSRRPKTTLRPALRQDATDFGPRQVPGIESRHVHFSSSGRHGMAPPPHAPDMRDPLLSQMDYPYPPPMTRGQLGGPGGKFVVDDEKPRPSCLRWFSGSFAPRDMNDMDLDYPPLDYEGHLPYRQALPPPRMMPVEPPPRSWQGSDMELDHRFPLDTYDRLLQPPPSPIRGRGSWEAREMVPDFPSDDFEYDKPYHRFPPPQTRRVVTQAPRMLPPPQRPPLRNPQRMEPDDPYIDYECNRPYRPVPPPSRMPMRSMQFDPRDMGYRNSNYAYEHEYRSPPQQNLLRKAVPRRSPNSVLAFQSQRDREAWLMEQCAV